MHIRDYRSQQYHDDVSRQIFERAKRLQLHLKTQIFDGYELIRVFNLILAFQMAFHVNGIHEARICWYSTISIKQRAGPTLRAWKSFTCLLSSCQERKLTSSFEESTPFSALTLVTTKSSMPMWTFSTTSICRTSILSIISRPLVRCHYRMVL